MLLDDGTSTLLHLGSVFNWIYPGVMLTEFFSTMMEEYEGHFDRLEHRGRSGITLIRTNVVKDEGLARNSHNVYHPAAANLLIFLSIFLQIHNLSFFLYIKCYCD